MSPPLISVRAELVRAAMKFTPSFEDAKQMPDRAGIRFEPSLKGVIIIAMDAAAMLVLRDPSGECDRPCTVKIGRSFFDTVRRASRDARAEAPAARLHIGGGETRLAGVTMPAPEIEMPYPNWRTLVPREATKPAPAIDPADDERCAVVAGILERMGDTVIGVSYAAPPEKDVVLARFSDKMDAFAVVYPLGEAMSLGPWQRPKWTLPSFEAPEARAA